ncbi:MAG: Ig domain-containing protein [Blastocatellia bacterium]
MCRKATPVITWNNPADIIYGTALSATQLNATANAAGGFSYSPASGTLLNAGNGQTLSVMFTPNDTINYTAANKSVQINVPKATPVITWTPPAFLMTGPLARISAECDGECRGGIHYTPAAGTACSNRHDHGQLHTDGYGELQPREPERDRAGTDNACGITVNPATLPAATRGTPFVQTLTASPTGSYVFSLLSGTLPPGVSLVNTLGIYSLRGIPTTAGSYTFTIKAAKANSTCAGARTYTVVVP